MLVAAPSESRSEVRSSRAAISRARERPDSLFEEGEPRVLSVGGGVPLPRGPRPRVAPVPVDAGRALEALLGAVPLDIVHVHDPFGPSVSATALRHSFSLNVGTFHAAQERLFSTHIARPLVEIFFGRLDVRTVTSAVTGALLERYFPGSYELVRPGADSAPRRGGDGPLRIAFCLEEERGALRLFLRALRRLPAELDWRASIWAADGSDATSLRISRRLRERVDVVSPEQCGIAELMAGSDVAVAASGGPAPAPGMIRRALAAGAVPVVSRLPVYSELVADGELGPMFQPGDSETLAGQLIGLAEDPGGVEGDAQGGARRRRRAQLVGGRRRVRSALRGGDGAAP